MSLDRELRSTKAGLVHHAWGKKILLYGNLKCSEIISKAVFLSRNVVFLL